MVPYFLLIILLVDDIFRKGGGFRARYMRDILGSMDQPRDVQDARSERPKLTHAMLVEKNRIVYTNVHKYM